MKRNLFLFFAILFICRSSILFAENSPIGSLGWHWDSGQLLNGKYFYDVDQSYREQDGWAYIEGHGKIHYWLYDTYSYHDGNGSYLMDIYIPKWIESMGYVIDFDHMTRYSPNPSLASSVKTLMKQRGCDVSVALITSAESPYVVINNYDKDKQYYWTDIIPLIK